MEVEGGEVGVGVGHIFRLSTAAKKKSLKNLKKNKDK